MKVTPVISVIIPCYNYGRFLPDACDSLVAQTMTDWECILVNNGKFAETREVANGYVKNDSRFKYLESDSAGPSIARNEGLAIAQGEFVQFLDADDKVAPDRFAILTEKLKSDPGLDLVYSGVKYFTTEQPTVYTNTMNALSSDGKHGYEGSGNYLYNLLIRRNIFVINSPIIRKAILEKIGAFNVSFSHLEDWDLWLRASVLIRKFEFTSNQDALAFVRSHATSLSQNSAAMKSHFLPILFSNSNYSRLSIKNILFTYVIASEFIIDSIFNNNFTMVWKMLISSANSFGNYLKILFHYMLLPLYLPLYVLLKLYRKFKK
jgi:glycosyltransferase involved in cell wall biosynthesis